MEKFSILSATREEAGSIVLITLNYVTHTLPASIIAWSEKEVLVG